MLINWAETAQADIIGILSYFATIEQMETGQRIVRSLQKATKPLTSFPMLGRVGKIEGTREIVLNNIPYLLVYRTIQNTVEILRVMHTARLFPETFEDEE